MGDNGLDEQLKELVMQYVGCDERSAELNDERNDIRKKVVNLYGDESSKAFQDEIARLKKDRRKKEGYDEARAEINRVIGTMDKDSLFAWQVARDDAKSKAKEAKRQEEEDARNAAKAEQKARNEEYKPAAEREPKPVKFIAPKENTEAA